MSSCPTTDTNFGLETMMSTWEYYRFRIPRHLVKKLEDYLHFGKEVGDEFLLAVLSNDLVGAYAVADYPTRLAIPDVLALLSACFPSDSFGSLEAYEFWVDRDELLFDDKTLEDDWEWESKMETGKWLMARA